MRVVFFGTPEIAVPSLEAVAAAHTVTALVCQPDRPKGRGKKLEAPPTKMWAAAHGVPVHQPVKLNDGAFEGWLRGQCPELCVIAAYGRILKQPILDVPVGGWLNVHPSLLPKYRGPSPIQSAVLNGDPVTGVTIMRLTLDMDAGDILLQEETLVDPDETAEALTQRLATVGARMLLQAIGLVEQGRAVFAPQDHARATYCKLFEKQDGQIRWEAPARTIHNLVRAATPWPIAHCLFRGEVVRVHKTRVVKESTSAPAGQIIRVERDRIVAATGEQCIAILEIQAPGKRAMPVADYLRGHTLEPGERFDDIT